MLFVRNWVKTLLIPSATFSEAVAELSTIRDFIRFTVTCLRAADVHIGHGSEDPLLKPVP